MCVLLTGYQTRGAIPSNFDVDYAYNLGFGATALISSGLTGYLATVNNLKADVSEWSVGGVPITALMLSDTSGGSKPLVSRATVDLNGPAYSAWVSMKQSCMVSIGAGRVVCAWLVR